MKSKQEQELSSSRSWSRNAMRRWCRSERAGAAAVERECKRQEAYEEFLKEKRMVDEIIRKIYEEDQMERQLTLEKVRATQQHIDEFKRQQAEWRTWDREDGGENRRIMEFVALSKKIEEERQQREEMEQVEAMEKKIRQRLMMQQTCQEQLAFKEMQRQAEKEEEEASGDNDG
ncbi:hypothetical protein INR49_024602 [Caranx melampygus]|nr:hypothetical protein INR49_024602 [Caranx melampygus]